MPIMVDLQITEPPSGEMDGFGRSDGLHYEVRNSLIDLSACSLSVLDEAVGITYGSSAVFDNCLIRGAGKLVLCGCGDREKIPLEQGKTVTFRHCILEDFGRRGPEVQDGMIVRLENCLIRNWGEPSRFDTRSFGAWAHHGGIIHAKGCVFDQPTFWRGWKYMAEDSWNHFWQACSEQGPLAAFSSRTYLPGVCRGLTAGPGGRVDASGCHAAKPWIVIENHSNPMSRDEALELVNYLESLRAALLARKNRSAPAWAAAA